MAEGEFIFEDSDEIEATFIIDVQEADHNALFNRDIPDQHPISAITGLTEALAEGSSNLQEEINRAEAAEQALDDKIEAETTRAEGAESGLNTAIGNETTARIQADTTLQSNITAEENRAKGIENGLRSDLTAETTARENADTGLQGQITTNANDIDSIEDKIPSEASSSNQLADKSYVDTADSNLQSQIDAISASSDVTDIVGTYAELQAYDTSTLTNDDIIKVLQDESQDGATTYYRWVLSGSSGSFVLIGSEGPYYTKAEADELYDEKQDEITATNKLDSDLVDDNGQTNKFVTASEKAQISTNATDITALQSGKADKSTTYTKNEVDTIASGKANVGLDNLNADGQMVIDSANGTISNCILEIPQNLKLTLGNNVLTLKSGSILVLANGTTYTTVQLANDISRDISTIVLADNNKYIVLCSANQIFSPVPLSRCASGNTLPATDDYTYYWYYKVDEKILYFKSPSDTTWRNVQSAYPICILTRKSGEDISFAKDSHGNNMIFNGMGFIGHHIFTYPNISGLAPYGYNEDKTLKSVSGKTSTVQIVELNSLNNSIDLLLAGGTLARRSFKEVQDIDTSWTGVQYVKIENMTYLYSNGSYVVRTETPLISYNYDGTTVTDFTIRQPVRLATTEMLDKVQDQVDTNTSDIANKQETLVSGTNIKTINGTTVLGSGNFTLADQSLSNLDSTGQMIVDTQNGTLSQCVTYTPDNLILEISGTTFTAKSGSIITMAGSTYSTVTLTEDKARTLTATKDGKYQMFYQNGAIRTERILSDITSGNTASIPATFTNTTLYFNTDDKLIYHKSSGTSGEVWENCSYPLCTLELRDGVWSFAKDSEGSDYIFSSCGWIGHHIFTFPSPKYLSGNGKTDGKLVSYSQTLNTVAISEMSSTAPTGDWFKAIVIRGNNNTVAAPTFCRNVQHFSELLQQSARLQYVEDDNICYAYSSSGWQPQSRLFYIRYEYDGTDITEFIMPRPYKGARNMLTDDIEAEVATKQVDVTTLTGYDSTQTQTLKNINGVLQWVTD